MHRRRSAGLTANSRRSRAGVATGTGRRCLDRLCRSLTWARLVAATVACGARLARLGLGSARQSEDIESIATQVRGAHRPRVTNIAARQIR